MFRIPVFPITAILAGIRDIFHIQDMFGIPDVSYNSHFLDGILVLMPSIRNLISKICNFLTRIQAKMASIGNTGIRNFQ